MAGKLGVHSNINVPCLRCSPQSAHSLTSHMRTRSALFCQSLVQANRLTSPIRQACLRTTPFSHAFRPRFPATPKPRLSATSFSHAFRPCLPTCHSDPGRWVFVTTLFQANELWRTLSYCNWLTNGINKHEGLTETGST